MEDSVRGETFSFSHFFMAHGHSQRERLALGLVGLALDTASVPLRWLWVVSEPPRRVKAKLTAKLFG